MKNKKQNKTRKKTHYTNVLCTTWGNDYIGHPHGQILRWIYPSFPIIPGIYAFVVNYNIIIMFNYRLIIAYLLFASEFRQNNARALRFWCVKCTNPKGECIGQASKLKRMCIILSKFSSIQSKYADVNLIHTRHKQTFVFYYVINKTF